ncbi:hypothetical protein LTR37_003177 [Vermiconidia calcicola]|uniref:Uncharacterized protein n=1 Tax=Vermiconidia calcicola TaxID=1690605 RepID=A0ACC3NQU7_9PEZI|nr:hypothetical protein LTR37_003177 [Vermiconidia calcicola]
MSPSATTSPPASPAQYRHQQGPSTASLAMQRAKRSSSRITDGVASRSSDEGPQTAVKVAVRVRPPLKPTDPGYDLIPYRFRDSTCETPTPTSLCVQSPQGKKLFVFDRVFDGETTQDGIWEYLSDSVSSFVKGYNVSILAYGQSGSGKSYTMGTSGPEEQARPEIMGVVPRAAQKLFEKLNGSSVRQSGLMAPKRYSQQVLPTMASFSKGSNTAADRNWSLKATYVEIYQEQLRDLLVDESIPQQDRAQVAIREDTKGRIMVTGLTQVTINSVEDLLNALNFGSSIRQTDSTNLNERSSRSHAVFSLNLIQKKPDSLGGLKQEKRMSTPIDNISGAENVVTLDSKLHFVDLAGSERLKNTGATGDRAKEGISINAGLASLGKVIAQLSSKHINSHISYRDSKLTRLLQDSLGGNAITFMVACVTPSAFHISETLNTVHYAQRARAIQSKPEIQQTRDESDKQAAIDRLRAEVSFLRDQIRHSERVDNMGVESRNRSEKMRGKEAELETQLMDMQENYNALSNRHAKLISELSKARDGSDPAETPLLNEAIGANALDRVKRSNSFASAVEQMIMEYEKTIQSLESSLSRTRGSLSNSESTLFEKETRIAYMETIQQQLQTRMQKALDREQSNESYLHDLESRIEGTTFGEERNSSLINELRKELARVRESESSAEDYISTLEERLAEAEQDHDTMQQEIDRLEHVVERQRSIGRLDNLLGELDSIRHPNGHAHLPGSTNGDGPMTNGYHGDHEPFTTQSRSVSSMASTHDEGFEDAATEAPKSYHPGYDHPRSATEDAMQDSPALRKAHGTTQNDFMADKVETLNREVFDLRSDNDHVTSEFNKLKQKYQTALETLANLQYDKETQKEDSPGPVVSFLADAGMRGEEKGVTEEQPSSSRSSSAELSSRHLSSSSLVDLVKKTDRSGSSTDRSEIEDQATDVDPEQVPLPVGQENARPEVAMLKKLNAEQEVNVTELTKNYKSLHARHEATLQQVEELRHEASRARDFRPSSPSFTKPYFSRRKSEDLMSGNSGRASRCITSLKTLANENFEQDPDTRQSFELNLNTVMNELQNRSDKAQALEAELATVKKEMENKQTIISGLTRERGSLKASLGVDFSVVQQMREQLLESEDQIRALHDQHALRERELQNQIESLKSTLTSHADELATANASHTSRMPGGFETTPMLDLTQEQAMGGASQQNAAQADEVARLQSELSTWETRHNDAMSSMQASEARLLETIADLENSMRDIDRGQSTRSAADGSATAEAATAAILAEERAKHQDVVEMLQREIEEYKTNANGHVMKLQELETAYASITQQVDEDAKTRDLSSRELKTHKNLVANLENQLQVHKSAITIHQESLESLQASHSRELEELKVAQGSFEKGSTERYATLEEQHKQITHDLQKELNNAQSEKVSLLRSASSALGYETDASKLHSQIKGLVEEGKEIHTRHLKTINELKAVQEELQSALNHTVELENRIAELKMINEESIRNLEKVQERERKSSRLVEELEDQLNNNFDSHRAATNRLSTIQGEVAQQKIELERELENQKMKNQMLEVSLLSDPRLITNDTDSLQHQVETFRRQSTQSEGGNFNRDSLSPEAAAIALARSGSASSGARKSVPTALPTPPPSIPLPPLPGSPGAGANHIPNGIDGRATSPPLHRTTSPIPNHSPPGSRHTSNEVNTSQQLEEQEARIRTIEKHLFAEKQLTATLEEALVDLETSANRTKSEMEQWRKKCSGLESELHHLQKERTNSRASLQAVEEEREMRVRAERARQALEQRMMELNSSKNKKKKSTLNCF